MFHMWADELIEAVEMQHRRLTRLDLPDGYRDLPEELQRFESDLAMFHAEIDLDFYCVALRRLLRISEAAGAEGYGSKPLRDAIKHFKVAAPIVVDLRDWAEHSDDWARSGAGTWTVFSVGPDVQFTLGNHGKLSVGQTTAAARALYEAIKGNVHGLAPNEVVQPLKRGEGARAIQEGTYLPDSPDPRINRERGAYRVVPFDPADLPSLEDDGDREDDEAGMMPHDLDDDP